MRIRVVAQLVAICAVLALVTTGSVAQGTGGAGRVHFTAAGDYAAGADTDLVLRGIAARAPDLNLALGDLSYGTPGEEQAWCDFVTQRVGAGFPFQFLSGNHESDGLNGNIDDFTACLPNQLPGLVGTYGRQWYVDVPAVDPLVRFVMISPALTFPGSTWSYHAGSARYDWTAAVIDGARSAGVPWVVVGAHKPCVSVGQYECDMGQDLVDLLISKQVDLVLFGHEHIYARTHQLGLGSDCSSLAIGTVDADCVRDADASMSQGAGTVFATVGTGGVALRDVNPGDTEAGYFATMSGANSTPSHGFLDVQATADSLRGRFVPVGSGTLADAFTITRGTTPDED